MKVSIDEQRCAGHGRCYAMEPDLFAPIDDDGHAGFLLDGRPLEAVELRTKLAEVSANCPEEAITIDESESAQW
ncbi:ferredoxin [Mycolicibacterium holsaticum]|uniref:ferredoxin n=1 Tax=Mycolicibacterium holsaticum TaxID=152142 RepID=UPI001C7D278C|nr:ferredoxin [Mycolicibacterium holsaticum]QZA12366.1 ferredoxin [Mycolicibacterium holsaticum DSM 44478 = JCM 12374]UNC10150.1 ferredoxin [Mycolicibacterium holsaticum DSM 44478 = JCM 12374]